LGETPLLCPQGKTDPDKGSEVNIFRSFGYNITTTLNRFERSAAMEARIWHQHYDPGVGTSIDYPDLTVEQLLTKTSKKSPDDIAIIFGGLLPLLGERHGKMTYQQLNELVDRFAAGLQRLGLQKGERVALYMPNCPQYVIAYYGVLRAGGMVVPCNPLYVARELKHQLNDAGARFAVTLSLFYKNVRQVRADTRLST
jgi:long-chain acyl-CoA synthetase